GALDRALAAAPDAVGATVVSPTYFGAVADVAGLADVAHRRGVPLVVDEAWGAHLAFHEQLPDHALALDADLVISSTHKIVGSLRHAVSELPGGARSRAREGFAEPPPWGELVLTPRDAFLAPQEVVPAADAVGRVAAESLAAYPPGIPNVLPGERLSADTLA